MSTFGTILSFSKVEQYFLELADKWFEEYIAAVERELEVSPRYFPNLADFGFAFDDDKYPEERLPFLHVNYLGLNDNPSKQGNGIWSARPVFVASIIVSTPTKADTRFAMHAYGAAFMALVLQHKSLEHPEAIGGVTWLDHRPRNLGRDAERSIGAMDMFFMVDVKNIVDERGTPPEPNPRPDPYVEPGDPVVIETPGPIQITERSIDQ